MKTTDGSGNVEIEVLQKVFFGGDQLTEERARNARQGRADGDRVWEIGGAYPKGRRLACRKSSLPGGFVVDLNIIGR